MQTIDFFPLYLTVKVSVIATAFSFCIGIVIAWVLAKKEFRGKNLLDALVMQPLIIPPTVLGYYLLVMLGRGSLLGRFLENSFGLTLVFNWKGAVIASAIASMPLFIKPARAAIESVDRNIENAARLLGKSEFKVFISITFPLARRGILTGTVMAFARSVGDFGTTLMVAGNIPGKTQTVSIAIYDAVQANNILLANILVLIITIFSVSVLFWVNKFTRGK